MEVFKIIAAFNKWILIWPEIALGLLAIFILVVDLVLPEKRKGIIPLITVIGQIVICAGICWYGNNEMGFNFNQMIYQAGYFTKLLRVLFLISSILVTYLGYLYFKKHALLRSEFYAILLIGTAALMLLTQANHFVMLFVALETFTIASCILTSYDRKSEFSLEAGLKFLIFGALSSAILLFGVVLLYGVAGNPSLPNATADALNFVQLGKFIEANAHNPMVQVGAILVLVGIFFKMGVVPFQIWIPDVYQGAPTPVTALLAVSSKAAGFIVMLNLVRNNYLEGSLGGPFYHLHYLLIPLFSVIAAVTILYGNIAALVQSNVKKLMGYSGIAHAGYLMMGIMVSMEKMEWVGDAVVIFYLFTYLLGSFCVFAVMSHMATELDEDQELADYVSLGKKHPFLAGVLTIGVGSLAGIPPLIGFMGKLFLLSVAFRGGFYWLVGMALVGVIISIYYYFGWIRKALFPRSVTGGAVDEVPACQAFKLAGWHYGVLGLLAFLTILFGIAPSILAQFWGY